MRNLLKTIVMAEDEIRVNCWNVEKYGENGLTQNRVKHARTSTIVS